MDQTTANELLNYYGITGGLALWVALGGTIFVNLVIYFVQRQVDLGRDKKIKELEAKLDAATRKLQTNLDVKSHVTRAQFDVEFNAYREIWKKLSIAYHLFGNIEQWHKVEHNDQSTQKIADLSKQFMDALNDLANTVTDYLPFYSPNIAKLLDNIRMLINEMADIDPSVYPENVKWKINSVNGAKFETIRHEIVVRIRERLASITVID